MESEGDKYDKIFSELSSESKKELQKLLNENFGSRAYQKLKHFIDQYDASDPVDSILGNVSADLIEKMSKAIYVALEISKERGNTGITGRDAGLISIRTLRSIADIIEDEMSKNNEE